ncbi:MAG: butyrate kinase [Synergistaceae bacterium]|jgi:butyrate kinase|nr:butyrate kinase [Synergistaceae bacterium]
MKILAISPDTFSTRVAFYENFDCLWSEVQEYDPSELSAFPDIISQEDYRIVRIKDLVESKEGRLGAAQVIVSSGGMLHSVDGGTYQISMEMLQDLQACKYGAVPGNIGASMAVRLATAAGTRYVYVVDPPVVDEMTAVGRMTGLPEISRKSGFHSLIQRSVVYREAAKLGKPVSDCNFIVCFLGSSEISVGAHLRGGVIEVNDTRSGSGPMSMTQSGDLPPIQLIDLCFSGKYTQDELKSLVLSGSGLCAHLGESDFDEIVKKVRTGDRKPLLTFEAFLYQIIKQVGGCVGILEGKVNSIILAGNLVLNEYFVKQLTDRVSWIAPVVLYPGEDDMLALIEGVMRVMMGKEEAKTYA